MQPAAPTRESKLSGSPRPIGVSPKFVGDLHPMNSMAQGAAFVPRQRFALSRWGWLPFGGLEVWGYPDISSYIQMTEGSSWWYGVFSRDLIFHINQTTYNICCFFSSWENVGEVRGCLVARNYTISARLFLLAMRGSANFGVWGLERGSLKSWKPLAPSRGA